MEVDLSLQFQTGVRMATHGCPLALPFEPLSSGKKKGPLWNGQRYSSLTITTRC
jgi:hypothetical protein